MKFAHMGDCHLGAWQQPELKELNFLCFKTAIDKCISQKVEFVLISGDLFDSAYPPIETLKESFHEFKRLKEARIPVFLIAGSHDYSVSGKSFLDVLEKAGFCTNVALYEERNNSILLQPTLQKNVAIYGYPGKKSGLEVDEIARIKLQDAPGLFKILMLHTVIRDAIGSLPINAVDEKLLPKVDYLALSHLHVTYQREARVYSGPIFPNNLSELEELQGGSFYIFHNGKIERQLLKPKEVLTFTLEITNALTATDALKSLLESTDIKDKIIIIKLQGIVEQGKIADIDFSLLEQFARKKGAFTFLKSTSRLQTREPLFSLDNVAASSLEQHLIEKFKSANPSKWNSVLEQLFRVLETEKIDDEREANFTDRLLGEARKVLEV